jgi:signal transduction histidine kinase
MQDRKSYIWMGTGDGLNKYDGYSFTRYQLGQGTGLGLSLGYDIIKAHGGEIKVGTKEGDGAAFIIQLPFLP